MNEFSDPIPLVTRGDRGAQSGGLIAENLQALKALFPSIVTDGKVDLDVLRQLLGDEVEEGEERYGLNWKGKKRARAFALTPSLGTLRPAKEDSVDWDTTKNIFIEGDNLEALKLLRKSYAGRVKLIYIDPPYNTGGDFVYPDDYRDSIGNYERLTGQRNAEGVRMTSNKEASGRFHTDWLNMMYPRLMLAKEFLSSDGFIAVSIDHNELSNLRACMDSIFGAENFKNIVIVRRGIKNVQAQFDDIDSLSVGHEYIVIYSKNTSARLSKLTAILADFQAGKWDTFWRGTDRRTMRYELFGRTPERGQWRWSEDRTKEAVSAYQRFLDEGGTDESLDDHYLDHLHATNDDLNFVRLNDDSVVQYYVPPTGTKLLSNNWMDVSIKGNQTKTFDTEKHVALLRRLVEWIVAPGEIVLDFFGGSGTTGHAVMSLDSESTAPRRYIMVQLPIGLDPSVNTQRAAAEQCDNLGKPRNIAELTKDRLRKAGDEVKRAHPDAVDTGFRVYKLDTSNLKPWQPDPDDLAASLLDAIDNVLPDRGDDDLLVELLLKTGIDLTVPGETRTIAGKTVHALGGGVLMVCLADIAEGEAEELGQRICDWRDELDPPRATTFYFKDSGFESAATKANLAAIIRQRLGKAGVEKLASI